MMRRRILSILFVCAAVALWADVADCLAQLSPDESVKRLRPPADVPVSLWANEPMVNNPTAMEIDSRGRVWIAEGRNYRMKMKEFDDLKRIDGADRIRILEDTDGDGKADRVTDFANDLFPVPLGMAIEEIWDGTRQTGTRVYVGNSPDLLVLEDTDGDDVADRRYPLLTGFRGIDSDHGLHGMSFGPDGRLYFTVGDGRYGADQVQAREATFDVKDRSGRKLSANNFGTTLRVNRDGTELEVLTSGHRNNYEAAVDSYGNVFGSDNDDDGNRGCRMYWVIDGGRYGYQHPESTRHWAEELPGIIPKLVGTGNGAPGGLLVYEGNALPERYRGAVLQIDSGTHHVNAFPLRHHGAGFRSDYQVLLTSDDDWFRPVDLAVAPDGSLFVCDWYDAGVGGNRFSDQTTGRIYRIGRAEPALRTFDPRRPINGLQSPNITTRLAARDLLVRRGQSSRAELLKLFQSGSAPMRARALHVLFDLPETGQDDAVAALSDGDPRIRETALRLLATDVRREWLVAPSGESSPPPPAMSVLDSILPLAADRDPGVRRTLLLAIRDVPTANIKSALERLIESWDGRDRYYLEAIRSALLHREGGFLDQLFKKLAERAVASGWDDSPVALPPFYPVGTNDAFLKIGQELPPANNASRLAGVAWALGRTEALPAIRTILSRNQSPAVERALIKALSQIDESRAGELLVKRFLTGSIDSDNRVALLNTLSQKVDDQWQSITQQPTFDRLIRESLNDPKLAPPAMQLIGRTKSIRYADVLMELAKAETEDVSLRADSLVTLGKLRYEPACELAADLLQGAGRQDAADSVRNAALEVIAAMADRDELIGYVLDDEIPAPIRGRAMQLAAATPHGAATLLQQCKSGALNEDLTNELAFLLRNHADRQVRRMAERELPQTDSASEKVFDASLLLTTHGSAERGKQLFETHPEAACARCHRNSGEGNLVGPDLASIGMKYGARELLYHIQYPSAAINYNFVSSLFLMDDGRVLTGLVLDRNGNQIRLGLATGDQITIPVDEIEQERVQDKSLMPEGLLVHLSEQQVADLIEYLITLRQGDLGSTSQR